MMNKTSAHTSVPAVVIVSVVVLSLVLAACGASQTPSTATITAPANNAQFLGGDEVKIEGKVTGSAVKKVDIYVNGAKFATIDKATQPNEFAVSVVWTAPADIAGSNVIVLKGLDDKDQSVISSDAVFITVQPAPTPTAAPTVAPTSLPTAVPATATPLPAPAAATTTTTTTTVTTPVSSVIAAPRPENDLLNVRALPDVNSTKLGQLNKGQTAPAIGKSADGQWFLISFAGAPGNVGWVFGAVTLFTGAAGTLPVVQPGATAASVLTSTVSAKGTVTTTTTTTTTTTAAAPAGLQAPFVKLKSGQDFANVRTGPDVAYQRLGQIDTTNPAAAVKGKNTDASWYQIAFASAPGGVAWVYGLLVDFTGDITKVSVATAPPLPTAAPTVPRPPTAVPTLVAPTATSNVPASSLLPYSQSDSFQPRNDIGDVPLGVNGQPKSSKWTWVINGAKSAELEITVSPGPGIFKNCPAGNLGSVQPNSAAGKRIPVGLPSGSFDFTITGKGYYLFTLYIVKNDGSTTSIPRNVIVDCYKTQ